MSSSAAGKERVQRISSLEHQVAVEMSPNRIERVNKAWNSQAHPYLMLKSKGQQNISPGVAN